MNHMDFSSWPREQEQSFVVYEQRASDSQRKAVVIGVISAVTVLVLALGIYAGVAPDNRNIAKDMNMSNLTKKTKKAVVDPAPAPTPAPEAAPSDKPATDKPAADKPASDTPAAAPTDKK